MALKAFWIQLENHAWDMSPQNINRMTGETMADMDISPVENVELTSPETGATHKVTMFDRVKGEALILRRYNKPKKEDGSDAWTVPHDHKVNPWDLNEPDPTDDGTMGTIPGATIECEVGDEVIVYFRNKDLRALSVEARAHSLHPHGIVFPPEHDGAYPLSPPDFDQPVGGEAAFWAQLGVIGCKQGDRVPPEATFTYRWNTFGWPSTAGVWLYHDHSICDHDSVLLGAIGVLVIHNKKDEDDVLKQDFPRGEHLGRLTKWCFCECREELGIPLPGRQHIDPSILAEIQKDLPDVDVDQVFILEGTPALVDLKKGTIKGFFECCYIDPPKKALYLQLYHEMKTEAGIAMAINGRRWLGNTPTLIGGLETKMRFGLVAMNNITFHTFHLHAHRWVVPGPSGKKVGGGPGGIQESPLDHAVSQFEDTKIFGPANSFSFTINQGDTSFMGPPLVDEGARGEWHMHCHVMGHMHGGMMGSLLIIKGGELCTTLPRGIKCPPHVPEPEKPEVVPPDNGVGPPIEVVITVDNFAFTPSEVDVTPGSTVVFDFKEGDQHTVEPDPDNPPINADPITITKIDGGDPSDFAQTIPADVQKPVTITGDPDGKIPYRCGIHNDMKGTINIVKNV